MANACSPPYMPVQCSPHITMVEAIRWVLVLTPAYNQYLSRWVLEGLFFRRMLLA